MGGFLAGADEVSDLIKFVWVPARLSCRVRAKALVYFLVADFVNGIR